MKPPRKPAAKASPPTKRGASGTGRTPQAAPEKNNLPMILGIVGGVVAVLVIVAVVVLSGDDPKPEKGSRTKEAKADTPRKAAIDVSGLEATGKSKCDQGRDLVQPRLNFDPSAPKDRVRNDLEAGIKLLNDGLEAYRKATDLAGKKYPLDDYKRFREQAARAFATDCEKDGKAACDKGRALILDSGKLMTGRELSDEERAKLKKDLTQGTALISEGMLLLSRVKDLLGQTSVETNEYQEALKVARMKKGELQ